jgi:hypothetical protein
MPGACELKVAAAAAAAAAAATAVATQYLFLKKTSL